MLLRINAMLENSHYVFWILILHSCDESAALKVTTPVQTYVGWNASFSMQLYPFPNNDSLIRVWKNGVLIMQAKGTQSRDVAERFEFTGNTYENLISFILRNVTLGDAGTYNAAEGVNGTGEQTLIVKASPSKPQIIALTSSVLGSDYRLNCSSVSNSVPPDHGMLMMSEWKVNDNLIVTGGHFKIQGIELTITSLIRQDNNIKLTCVAYEDSLMKSVPSNGHVIDVKYGPDNVQLDPSSGIVLGIENRSIMIRCMADCNPTCSFQWRRESVPGYLKTNQTMMIDNVGKSDTDNYTCTVSNSITGRSQSLQIKLVAMYGPASGQVMLSSSQANQIVEDNTLLNITCSADCFPPCNFTWTGPQDFSQSGAQLSRVVDRNKGGNYICTASNQDNLGKSATASVTVTVMYGPGRSINLGSNPPSIFVNLHQRAPDITCDATCNPACNYRWYHNRKLYSSDATLSLGVVENKTSEGNYTCEAYNRFLGLDRSSYTFINISVFYGAEIVSLSVQDSNTVNENSSAIFQCQVDSNPLPNITWREEGTNTILKTESGVVQSQFRIESAQCQDTDNYTCSAYNGIWTQANRTLQFFVKCHPRTDSEVSPETKVYKKRHEAAFLRYTVISYPLPKFVWMFLGNGSEIKDLPGSASPYVNGRQSELRFTSLNIDDFGYYSVIADNSLPPSAREVFQIISADVPEVPSNITITEVTENSITVQWVAGYNGGPKQTFYVFASTGDFTRNFTASDPGYGIIGTLVIKGLAASSKYSIYMSASNSVGSSSMTEAIFVITLEEPRTETLGNLSIPAIAGGIGAGAVVILLVLLSIFLWRRYQYSGQHSDEDLSEKLEKRGSRDSGLVPNPVYDSSESQTAFSINQGAIGTEFAAVVKPKKKVDEKENQSNLYAQVDKTLRKEKKGGTRGKGGKASKGDIYENAVLAGQNFYPETKYGNSKSITIEMSGESLYEDPGVTSSNIPVVKKDGLLYADLVLNPPATKNGKPIIRGIENCTEYADIAYGKKGETLPDISDEKEKNRNTK